MGGQVETLDTEEGLEGRRNRHWYDRLMMLSDGVFAIAITFLAADITTPSGWNGTLSSLSRSLAPQLDAYAMSFLVISVYWLAHRRLMAMVLTVDAPVTVLNLVMLGLVALLPAATRLISTYNVYPVAQMAYAGLVVAIGGSVAAMWGYAALVAKTVSPEVGGRLRWFFMFLMVLTPPFFLLLTLAIPAPGYGVVPLTLVLLFLIGWRLRRWTIRRLGGKAHVG
jgi:uncharacterized membrane protein